MRDVQLRLEVQRIPLRYCGAPERVVSVAHESYGADERGLFTDRNNAQRCTDVLNASSGVLGYTYTINEVEIK